VVVKVSRGKKKKKTIRMIVIINFKKYMKKGKRGK